MTTQDVTDRLINPCREGEYMQPQKELCADSVVSIEPEGSRWRIAEAIEPLNAKIDQWSEMLVEVHSMEVSDLKVAGNFISCKMTNDITYKG